MKMTRDELSDKAEALTHAECRKKRIAIFCKSVRDCGDAGQDHRKGARMTHYSARAQDIYNRHYDELDAS